VEDDVRAPDIVDLTGRQDEPAVLRVLVRSHGSREALDEVQRHYQSGEWTFIGVQDGDEILACAGAERLDNGTIGIRSIAVEPSRRNQGLGRTLLDALAERLGAERVIAETDDDAVGFYRRCGFTVEDTVPKFGRVRYRCTRDEQPLPSDARSVAR
jgi:ribosomal protein S18 acetylase RimI-like enzyme